jgi:hypothetical protein
MLPLGGHDRSRRTPIEINLNVTIRREVLVRLQRDVEQLIKQILKPPSSSAVVINSSCGRHGGGCVPEQFGPGCSDAPAAKRAGQIGERQAVTWAMSLPRRQPCGGRSTRKNIRRRSLYSGLAASKGLPEEVGICRFACS